MIGLYFFLSFLLQGITMLMFYLGFNEYSDSQLSGYQIPKFYTNYSDISGYYSGIRVKNIRIQIVFNE